MSNLTGRLAIFHTKQRLSNAFKQVCVSSILLFLCFFSLQAQTIIYSEGFEGTDGSFTHSGTYDSWQWGTPSPSFTQGPATANSGTKCWGTNLSGNVPANHDAYLVSPNITLPTITGNQVLRVRFFGWIAIDYMYDRGEFQITRDNSTWSTLAVLYCTMQGGWNEYYFDISNYAGSQIKLRFRCKTDASDAFSPPDIPINNAGFYIDDIAITLTNTPSDRTLLTFEGNEDPSTSASCPYILPWNGTNYVKDNDIYSTARGRNGEYTDYYLLQQQLVSSENSYKLRIAEIDQEESYTDKTQLVVVDHKPNTKIAPDENGNIYAYRNPITPIVAIDNDGTDVIEKISFEDGNGAGLHNNDFIDLEFNINGNPDTAIFVLKVKGFLTDSAGEGTAIPSPPRILIQTQKENGDWVTRNFFYPRVESAMCAYNLSGFFPFSNKVRLLSLSCLTGKYHSLDFAGLDTTLQESLSITRLSPVIAINSQGNNVLADVSASDSVYAHISTGEFINLEFDKPSLSATDTRDFIFISKGYYIPNGTYFFYTWDGTRWVQRDGWSIPQSTSVDQTRQFDLSLWLPDPSGEYKVRIWQDYIYHPAEIDFVGLSRGTASGTMVSATDLRTSTNIMSQVNTSDNVRFSYPQSTASKLRNRWVEIHWSGLTTNMPPTTNPVTVTNQTSPTPQINWTYQDAENNPQQQYEVEVWTGSGGTGSNEWDPAVGTGTGMSVTYAGLPLTNGQRYYVRVKAFDGTGWGGWSEANWTYAGVNIPPDAKAGPDQTISTGASGCVALATLDGTGSSDPRGETITYRWTGPFSGFLTGASPSVNLPLGTNQIILTVTNASGLTDIDTVIITVRDLISPIPSITTLPDITAQCSITLTTPTATDNCGGVINGTTSITTFNTQDTFDIEWAYLDPSGNRSQQPQRIIISDNTPPVPQVSSLPVITGNCSAEITTVPTALDNCTGIVSGTTIEPRSYNKPGNYTITWRYTDNKGNTSSQTQSVIINDITPPVPMVANLPELSATCSLTITTAPTAFDSCTQKTIAGSTTNPLTYNNPGIFTISWTYTDSSGNSSSQLQKVSIIDVTAPVADKLVLDTIRSECTATVTDTPTATDNCCGTIRGVTSDSLTCTTQGTHTIVWRYTDRTGNTSTQNQSVIIDDTTRPVPLVSPLPVVQGECSVTISSPPKASDNCGPTITATTSDPLVYTEQGTHTITWLYDDLHGNKISQTQSVIIKDNTPPVPELSILPTITSACNVELTPPFANDNCAGRIAASTPSLSITDQGTHTVIWTYNDGNGNTVTQNQTVIIKDSIPPVFGTISNKIIPTKSVVFGLNVPVDTVRATDNCTRVAVQGIRNDGLRLDTLYFEGTTLITWTACDTNNNCSTATQTITVIRNHAPGLQIPADTSLSEGEILSFAISASDSDGTIPSLFIDSLTFPFVFKDSANGHAALSLRPGCTDHGTYLVKLHATDGIDTTTRAFNVSVKDINYPPEFDTTSYYVAHEMVEFKTVIHVYDCDNPNPKIRIINAPKGSQFTNNNNGTGTFTWTPSGSDNGFYMVIFEAQDDMTTVRDTIIIEITDVNAYTPELTVSFSDSTVPLNLPVVICATARDRDGPLPIIKTSVLPAGSQFNTDNNGNAIVRWTPKDTGTFRFDFVAIDAADTTVTVTKQVKLIVADINVTGPKFSPVQNFVIDQNKQFSTTIEARDPDGTIPVLHLKSGLQTDLTFKDNGNGTATINWIPPCNVTGTFYLTATASDQSITDSVSFTITVRDINCPPVIFMTSDINAKTGEMVRIYVRAYDPDGDTVIPTLSAGCTLPGYAFTNSGNGAGVFRWQASYESGSYPVTFYASDGFETDSFTMHININMTGYVTIVSTTTGSSIFSTPSGSFTGEFLGIDSAKLGVAPGIYHFEVNKTGYRSERFAVKVFADSSVVKFCTLKPSIPLITSLVDTMFLAQAQSQNHTANVFTDLNNDGYLDYTVLSSTGIKVFLGLDSSGIKYNSKSYDFPDSIPATSIFHFDFVDWNNDKSLDCIYSDLSGNIVVANFRTGTFESIVNVPGGKLYISVLDVNNDHKKDLIIHNEGYGLSVYLNQGTDNSPVFTSSYPLVITSGQTPVMLHGPCTFIDINGDGNLELLIRNVTIPSIFKINNNFTEISYIEDLNCAGKRITSDSLLICQIGSPSATPYIILRTAAQSILFNTHLLGDVNNDNKVDIRDISKISRLWEITDTDPSWDPQCNLRLSTSGQEKIDIRDISQAGKCWELQQ